MKNLFGILVVFIALAVSYYGEFNIGIGITLVLIISSLLAMKKGNSLDEIVKIAYLKGKKSFLVIQIFFLVGIVSSLWINSGTIPGIVYYGIKFMNPSYFYVLAFFISSAASFLLGSSLGTAGTIGIAIIAVGRGIGVDPNIAGGAILSGVYFGDRCSPVSSSANLIATLTETNLYTNIKNMFRTGTIPFLLTAFLYNLLAEKESVILQENPLIQQIQENFTITPLVFLPVMVILICAIFKINVKISMLASIVMAIIIGKFIQNYSFLDFMRSIILGFTLNRDVPLALIIKGGGLISVWKACLTVFISCSLSGVIEKLEILNNFDKVLMSIKSRGKIFLSTLIVSLVTAALGCNQSIAVVMTNEIMGKIYEKKEIPKEELAIDIENTGIVVSALIPWNIAGMIPATMMGLSGLSYIGYSFYLYLIPLVSFVTYAVKSKNKIIEFQE
ncbi:MAG: Na+/H+ antiporter NhaC family protein [Cetobacterium sp.]|uniref:Na+/H+ antiporter NhaC family protein n=1 Tax=Cetobacterium sp. TaxID=2071632 RepID=UPI002FC9DCDC